MNTEYGTALHFKACHWTVGVEIENIPVHVIFSFTVLKDNMHGKKKSVITLISMKTILMSSPMDD